MTTRVATYNIHHGAPPGRFTDLSGCAAGCTSLNADILALQEVDRRVWRSWFSDTAARLSRATGLLHTFAPARRLGVGWYGNALLTRNPTTDVELIALPTVTGREPRGAILASVPVDGTPTTVVVAHLQNHRRRDPKPPEAVAQLDVLLQALARRPTPWLVMGDFNLGPEYVEPALEARGLTPVPTGPTFPVDHPRLRIDWIALRGLEATAVELHPLPHSDHQAVVAEIRPLRTPDPGS